MPNPTQPIPAIITIFGAQGDLATRKIIPALGQMYAEGVLHPRSKVIGLGRHALTAEAFADACLQSYQQRLQDLDDAEGLQKASQAQFRQGFIGLFDFVSMDYSDSRGYEQLQQKIADKKQALVETCAEVFYLSTHSELIAPVVQQLHAVGLLQSARVVIEKPIGDCYQSANAINEALMQYLYEEQVFRIDHYLGKEAVQNLLALRLGNSFMESLWNRNHISHIEISAAEEIGIERRGDFYDKTGALRDMVQSHLLQLLSIVAMEAPINRSHDSIRDEKVKVLKSLRHMNEQMIKRDCIRAQYRGSGRSVSFYEERNVASDSTTETFVALKCWIDNWRWSGVPFYLRTGKKMPKRLAEIVIYFRSTPVDIFPIARGYEQSHALVIELNPNDRLSLFLMAKTPGDEPVLKPVELSLDFNAHFGVKPRDAYERLLSDVIKADLTLFLRHDEVSYAWQWVDEILQHWQHMPETLQFYDCNSWGPIGGDNFLNRDGYLWAERLLQQR